MTTPNHAVSARSTMQVRRFLPAPELRSVIDCYWTGRFGGSAATDHHVEQVPFVPGAGGLEIFVHLHGGFAVGGSRSPLAHVSCWRENTVTATFGVDSEFFVTRLRAGAAVRLVAFPIAELADRFTEIGDIWGAAGEQFAAAVRSADCDSERASVADAFFKARVLPQRAAAIAWAIARLEREHVGIQALSSATGLSVRQFETRFLIATGNSPVRFRSLSRLRRSIKMIAAAKATLASLLDEGYFDQAQQIREFRKFTGMTPGEFRRVLQSGNHFYNLPAQARASLLRAAPREVEVA